jgi:protein phosphatase
MTILIVSDLHANLEAIEALPKNFDELWVLGDLVNYGPDPAAAIQYVRQHAAVAVRGNHDHAVAFGEDPHCSARFRKMAEDTCRYTRSVLREDDLRFLRELPLQATRELDGARFLLCHATPTNPLHEYRTADSDLWFGDPGGWSGIVLAGHTHLPFQRTHGGKTIVNPGSVGQPKHGHPEARYAIWRDGTLSLGAAPYDVKRTVDKVRALPLSADVRDDLAFTLTHGSAPSTP